jgi:pilus assembly protein CpaE
LNVILVGSTDRQLDEMLKTSGANVAQLATANLSMLAHAGAKQPDAIVLDLRGSAHVPPAVATIRRLHPDTGFVVVASTLDPALLLEAMRAGVSELVADPVTLADLENAIGRVAGQRPATEVGRVYGFVGAKGGIGTTTAAVNVATVLGTMSKPQRTLMIDLHQAGGDAAIFVGAEPRFSIIDALENTQRLDASFFRTLVVETSPGGDLLAAPDRVFVGSLDSAKIRTLIEFVSSIYKYTVIDLSRSDSAVLDALDQLSSIAIVVNQELATVKGASRLAATLRQRYGKDKIKVVLNRSDRQADIGHADVERALGSVIAATFPSDYRLALHALNTGRPIALDNHNDLSASFRRFALELAGTKGVAAKSARDAAPRSGLLGRLTQRRP